MTTPVEARLTDLRQEKAWPLVAFLIGTGRLRLDMDLMASKNLTGLAAVVRSGQPQAFEVVTEAGLRLGWTQEWVRTVAEECLAVIVAWSGVAVRDLTAGDLDPVSYTHLDVYKRQAQYQAVTESLRGSFPEIAAMLEAAEPDMTGFAALPREHWQKVW